MDIDDLMNAVTTDANDTSLIPVPEGEYNAVSDKPTIRKYTDKKTGESKYMLNIMWRVDSKEVEEIVGRSNPGVLHTIFLDVLENGSLDMGKGKNTMLGKVRDALGLNAPGRNFTLSMLEGQMARIFVKHSLGSDNQPRADVKAVGPCN